MAPTSRYRRSCFALPLVTGLLSGLVACSRPQIVQGDCHPVNGADICVWEETSGKTVLSFGATIPISAIENAPPDAPMVWPPVAAAVIPLPDHVRGATGFDNLTFFWEPHGHPPGPFLTPHFDFHFNTSSAADLKAMDCADSTKPAALPVGYELLDATIPQLGTLIGLCVPGMGMHALPSAVVNGPAVFDKAMVVGYYHGRSMFVEPMISRATLLERHGFDLPIADVPARPSASRFPTRFRATYDSTANAYRFGFSAFTEPAGK